MILQNAIALSPRPHPHHRYKDKGSHKGLFKRRQSLYIVSASELSLSILHLHILSLCVSLALCILCQWLGFFQRLPGTFIFQKPHNHGAEIYLISGLRHPYLCLLFVFELSSAPLSFDSNFVQYPFLHVQVPSRSFFHPVRASLFSRMSLR